RPPPATERPERAIILIVLDGVRWQEVFQGVDTGIAAPRGIYNPTWETGAGLMPNLHKMIARGVALGAPDGTEIAASGPNYISLPGYMEIFAGYAGGCDNNNCPRPPARTIMDDVREAVGITQDVAVISSWPNIEHAAAQSPARIVQSCG